ncbi:MAG: hypothetical protein KER_02541 [Kerstersia gyiorum]
MRPAPKGFAVDPALKYRKKAADYHNLSQNTRAINEENINEDNCN